MIWNLDGFSLLMLVGGISVLGFFLGAALDAIMGGDGFGPFGNMALFIAGFFGAVYLANTQGIMLRDPTRAFATGLGGSFLLIAALALVKAGLSRLAR